VTAPAVRAKRRRVELIRRSPAPVRRL
jgi:hypothetical protein